jgi:RNA-directed DNA polymerase
VHLANHRLNTTELLNGREITFSRFLYYKNFYANTFPTILCEGKTDNVYIKAAIYKLSAEYPKLAVTKSVDKNYQLLMNFLKYSKRTQFLLQLAGGSSYLKHFIEGYSKKFNYCKAPIPQHPVIIILDNDSGFKDINNFFKKNKPTCSAPDLADNYKQAEFIHVIHNLYVVLTPLNNSGDDTAIEDLFDHQTRQIKVAEKSFNPNKDINRSTEYGKEIFAQKVIQAQKNTINFNGFKPLLNRIVKVIEHYNSIK